MYGNLKKKVCAKCIGDFKETDEYTHIFNGKYRTHAINIYLFKKGNTTGVIKIFCNDIEEKFTNEKDAMKFLNSLFANLDNRDALFNDESLGNFDEDNLLLDNEDNQYDMESYEDIENAEAEIFGKVGIVATVEKDGSITKKKNSFISNIDFDAEQVGYKDESLPNKKELEKMVKTVKKGYSTNWYSGQINLLLKSQGLFDRYKLIYILKSYYFYDKAEEKVISVKDVLSVIRQREKNNSMLEHIYEINSRI